MSITSRRKSHVPEPGIRFHRFTGRTFHVPAIHYGTKSGETFEGWLVFKVALQNKAPLVYYSIHEGGGTQYDGGKWFVLKY